MSGRRPPARREVGLFVAVYTTTETGFATLAVVVLLAAYLRTHRSADFARPPG